MTTSHNNRIENLVDLPTEDTVGGMSRGYEGAPELMRVRSKQLEGGYLELTPSEWSQIVREQESSWEY